MSSMLVVADTNVIVSMLLWGGRLESLTRLVNEKRVQLVFSPATIDELFRVIRYPKFRDEVEKLEVPLESLVDTLIASSVVVHPSNRVAAVREDAADNRILEAALEASAACIITGDKHLLELKNFRDIPILTPRTLLHRLKT